MPSKIITSHISNLSDTGSLSFYGSTTLDLSSCSGAFLLPKGSSSQRPSSPSYGSTRWNSELKQIEYFSTKDAWSTLTINDDFDTSVKAGSVIYFDTADSICYPEGSEKLNTQTFHLDLDGTINNSIPSVIENDFKNLNFSAANHFISIPERFCSGTDAAMINGTGSTYSFWIKPNSAANVGTNLSDKVLFSINTLDGLTNVLKIGVDPQGSGLYYSDSASGDQRVGSANYNGDNWINVIVTRPEGTTLQTSTFYVNGQSIGTLTSTNPLYSAGQVITIGGVYDSSTTTMSANYGGLLSSVIIYDRPLSLNEITKNYNALKYRYGL